VASVTQINRPFRVKTPLGDDALLLDSFTGFERVSEPFRFVLRLLAPDPNVDLNGLLNAPAVLSIQLSDTTTERHIHGNISRVRQMEFGADGMVAYEAEMVPWFWFLSLYYNCRIYQNKSVPDIVEKVFQDRGFTDYELRLQGSYQPLDYCVQYRETDFNFLSRLLEKEGIFYFFEHSQDKHTLVLADATSAFSSCPNQQSARYVPSTGGVHEEDAVFSLENEFRVRTGATAMTDYDFEKPNTSLMATLSGQQNGESYDYPGGYKTKDDGDRYARIRLEGYEAQIATIHGQSNCMDFRSGYKFTLEDHFRDSLNTDYTILGVEHHAKNTSYRGGRVEPFEYSNRFDAIPNATPYRPPRRARKPVMDGVQNAVVVGKSGEEIWTDQYGRVRVQFFWDRDGTADENSSCWCRVAYPWAGKNWGFITIPRIGQEVLVHFLDGDPDRPIIIGSVYNAVQMPPYALPDHQTKSTWKSLTSKGGGGFNEIRFEDAAGSEQIFIQGNKNLDIRIKNDEYKTIENNLHLTVNKDRYEHIKNDHHTTIDNDMLFQVGRDHHLKVSGKQAIQVTGTHSFQVSDNVTEVFSQSHSEKVSMSYYLKAGTGIVIEDPTGITLKCGGNSVVIDPTGVTIKGTMVTIDGQLTKINSGPGSPAMSGSPGSAVSPTAPKDTQDADQADPGQMAQIQAQQQQQRKGKYVDISPTPHTPATVAAATAAQQAAGAAQTPPKTWIEIELVDKDGNPVPGERYQIKLPDGSVAEGTLDDKGHARVDGVDPGNCEVTFPNLDQTVWEPQ